MTATRRRTARLTELSAAVSSKSPLGARRDEIADRRAMLARRLDDGYQRIDAAIADGQEMARWEDFWLDLLREYEALFGPMEPAA